MSRRPSRSSADAPAANATCVPVGAHESAPWMVKSVPLVMRVAERAADWQARPTFVPWGTWSDGAIVFDGRWCAPLSVELARQLSGKLVAAKRAAAARAAGSPEHLP